MGLGAAATAGIVAAGVGAVGSVGSSLLNSSASKSAAAQQTAQEDQAAQLQLQEQAQTRADLLPYNTAGQGAAGSLDTILGLPGGNGINPLAANGIKSLTFQPTQAQLAATPGYQFDLAQAQQGVANSNAAQGRGVSGAALKGAANYAQGLANNTLQTQAGIFQSNLANVVNPLQNLANLGENAANQTGALGTQNTTNANQALIGGANAGAAGTVGQANALSGGLSGLGSSATNYALYNQLLNGGSGGISDATDSTLNSFPALTGGSL